MFERSAYIILNYTKLQFKVKVQLKVLLTRINAYEDKLNAF